MASTSFGFCGAAPATHTAANAHRRALFMRSRFFQGITQSMNPPAAPLHPTPYACKRRLQCFRLPASTYCTIPVECPRNPLIYRMLRFGHANAPGETGIGRRKTSMQPMTTEQNRRSKHRFAIERNLRYKTADHGVPVAAGSGHTIDVSSGGVAFLAE